MKKKYSLLLLYTLSAFIMTAKVSEDRLTLHFASDHHTLTSQHVVKIQEFLDVLSLQGDYEFLVKGHTDQDGSNEYNLALSKRRATSIIDYLFSKGVDRSLSTMKFSGEFELLSRSRQKESMKKNRRVDITFKRYEFSDLSEIEKELASESITNDNMNANEEHLMIGKNGTFLKISANSFLTEEGDMYNGEVSLLLTEALNLSSFIEHGLSTLSDGEMLISGGMYKIEALSDDGTPLILNSEFPLQVAMPSDNIQTGMSIFTSVDGGNWSISNQNPQTELGLIFPPHPVYNQKAYKSPKYQEFKKRKPYKPSEPLEPRIPSKPDVSKYQARIKWYQFFSKSKIKKKAEKRYQTALDRYNDKVERYDDKVEKYELDYASFPSRLKKYLVDIAQWEKEKEEDFKNFNEITIPEHYAAWTHEMSISELTYSAACEKWKEQCDSIKSNYLDQVESLNLPNSEQTNRYLFQQANLGWVNVDKFYKNENTQRREVLVQNDNGINDENVFLYFPKLNSCVKMYMTSEGAVRNGIPKGEFTEVFAYKLIDGQIQLAEANATNKNTIDLTYKPIKFSDFRKKINALGKT